MLAISLQLVWQNTVSWRKFPRQVNICESSSHWSTNSLDNGIGWCCYHVCGGDFSGMVRHSELCCGNSTKMRIRFQSKGEIYLVWTHHEDTGRRDPPQSSPQSAFHFSSYSKTGFCFLLINICLRPLTLWKLCCRTWNIYWLNQSQLMTNFQMQRESVNFQHLNI